MVLLVVNGTLAALSRESARAHIYRRKNEYSGRTHNRSFSSPTLPHAT